MHSLVLPMHASFLSNVAHRRAGACGASRGVPAAPTLGVASRAVRIAGRPQHNAAPHVGARPERYLPAPAPAVSAARRATLLTMAAAAAARGASHEAGGGSDLLVVGPGVLGSHLGKLWKDAHPGATVMGLTNGTNNHDRLRSLGLEPVIRATLPARKFPYVAFAAPPSGSEDYVADVAAAARDMWDGSGSFVFTSSMSVCAAENGETVTDSDCQLVPKGKGPSTDRLLGAEEAVLSAGGNVVRYVGLYHASRGAHTFFLKVKEVPRWGGYVVNLLHYEDAARLAFAVLRGDGEGPFKGQAFIGCDGVPVTFADMMAACNASGVPELRGEVNFTLPEDQASKGKRVFNDGTRARLGGWTPTYGSFAEFMAAGARDCYNS